MRIGDWSSDVCSSDLALQHAHAQARASRREGARSACEAGAHHHHVPLVRVPLVTVARSIIDAATLPVGCVRGMGWTLRPCDVPARKSVLKATSRAVRVDLGSTRNIKKTQN